MFGRVLRTTLTTLILLGYATSSWSQQKNQEESWNEYTDADDGGLDANLFAGGGTGAIGGGSLGLYMTRDLIHHQWFGGGGFLEWAQLSPSRTNTRDGLFSVNYQETLKIRTPPSVPHRGIFPFATFGYTRLLGVSNGVNYGGGIIFHYTTKTEIMPALRLEYRVYDLPGQGHNQTIRIAWQGEFNTP